MVVTAEQLEILRHAARNKPRQLFCGQPEGMGGLVSAGLMRFMGRVSWCPDPYFGLTDAGRTYLKDVDDAERMSNADARTRGGR